MRIAIPFLLAIVAAQAQSITKLADFITVANSLLQGADGNFYGLTTAGGTGVCSNNGTPGPCGAIFKVTTDGTVSTFYSFQPTMDLKYNYPVPDTIIQGADGNFYGTTSRGGGLPNCNNGCGTIFKLTASGVLTTLYTFDHTHGDTPNGNLVQSADGNFYGVTNNGGTGTCPNDGCGTVFQMTPQGTLTTLHNFNGTDGAFPNLLLQGADGNFYGTTQDGGAGNFCPATFANTTQGGCGTVFKMTPAGVLTTLYAFDGTSDGKLPTDLIQAADGDFYGTLVFDSSGAAQGLIFSLSQAGHFSAVTDFGSEALDSEYPNSLLQAPDGNLYGTTSGLPGNVLAGVVIAPSVSGTLFKVTEPGDTFSTLYNFCDNACKEPNSIAAASLILGGDGNLYGVTQNAGAYNAGILFRYNLVAPKLPAIASSGGVVNGASYQPGISPGSWISISGTNLATQPGSWTVTNGVLPTSVNGVSVSVGGQPAYVEYVSSTQINALAPSVPAGTVAVTVTNSNGTSQSVNAQLSAETPAFFQWGTYAVATRQDFSYAVKNGAISGLTTTPAKPGDVIILWGTGFGPTSPAAPAGMETPSTTAFNTATAVSVKVGGKSATVYGAALASGYAGLYQVAIQIPAGLAGGDYPVVATVAGASSPSTTLITVQQ